MHHRAVHQGVRHRAAHREVKDSEAHQEMYHRAVHRGVRHRAANQEVNNRDAHPKARPHTAAARLRQDQPHMPLVRRLGRSSLFPCTTIQKAFAAAVGSRLRV